MLEICLRGKEMTDDSISEVVKSLLVAVEMHDGISAFRLEELDLSNNTLTTTSLRRLVPLIEDSCYDIKDINLSDNNIRVETDQERDDWEAFLESFRRCRRMRRLDLSGNDLSKSLPLEIFLRVYSRHRWVDPVYLESSPVTTYSMKGGITEMTNSLHISGLSETPASFDPYGSLNSLSNGRVLEAREGLRSIPYIIVTRCSIGDAGVLHLSYILAQHHWPQHLMPELKKGSCEAQRRTDDDSTQCLGIVYAQNEEISSFGKKLFERAETARQDLAIIPEISESARNSDDETNQIPTSNLWVCLSLITFIDSTVVAHLLNRRKTSLARTRRTSEMSALSSNLSSSENNVATHGLDIDSLRKKLQRTTIENFGVQSVELWWAALKLQKNARGFLRPIETPLIAKVNGSSSSTELFDKDTTFSHSSLYLNKQPFVSGAVESSLITQQTREVDTLPSVYKSAWRWFPTDTKKMLLTPYRDAQNSKDLPYDLVLRILVEASDADNIVSYCQQKAIINHARSKLTLMREIDAVGKGDTHQKLKMLEAMGCLTYPMGMNGDLEY
jgi:hypothetical protein